MTASSRSFPVPGRWAHVLVLAGLGSVGCAGPRSDATGKAVSSVWHFDDQPVGRVPQGWRIDQTNPTRQLAAWQIEADAAAPSGSNVLGLVHTENYDGTYNLAIAEDVVLADLDLSVRVKAVAGAEDQGGGPIWRCQGADDYYICRINPLESNYRVYKVVNGRRRQLGSVTVELQKGRWYTLGVTMIGHRITCSLDGEKMLDVEDDEMAHPGRVGLWTKADAVTRFDDLIVHPAP